MQIATYPAPACGGHSAAIREALESRQDDSRFNVESLSENRNDFYGSYGSLFFLGILLSVGFSLTAVLIIYYKQISEGYEDQARFDIMQKVGMTRRDIRSSINSQLLLVFFLPLLLAGLHLVFAFPFVHKLLLLFNLWNTRLLVGTTAASFLAFAVLYTLVYRATSTAYYHIVSDGVERIEDIRTFDRQGYHFDEDRSDAQTYVFVNEEE